MKIGVIGLRPRQIADLRDRKFNGHELFFYEEKSYAADKVASFVRKVDKVLAVTASIPIPKRTLEIIPHSKCHHMAGSISSVIRYLDQLPSAEPPLEAALKIAHGVKRINSPEDQSVSTVSEAATTPEPILLASDVPKGTKSHYTLPRHDIVVNLPNPNGVQNYKILRAALPGDIVRFGRPNEIALDKWRNRVAVSRNGYWNQYGILTEAHFYEDFVDIVVVRPDASPDDKTKEVVQSAVEAPKLQETSTQSAHTAAEREFWDKVYIASILPGRQPENAAWFADEALRLRRERFGQ